MRSIFISLVFFCQAAFAFTDPIWQDVPYIYTNAIGMEFVGETVLRSRWAGDNWNFIKGDAVNIFGSSFTTPTSTGYVHFAASDADAITRQLEAKMAAYVHPDYTTDPDYCLDDWFANYTIDYWPGYRWPKAEFISRSGPEAGIITYNENGTNVTLGAVTNGLGEVIQRHIFRGWSTNISEGVTNITAVYQIDDPNAYWIKRLDRQNPLTVAQWKLYNEQFQSSPEMPTEGLDFPYYCGWPNEFSDGRSTLFDVQAGRFPVFIFHKGGTNDYDGTLSLEVWSSTYWEYFRPSDVYITEWASNSVYASDEFQSGLTIPLPTSVTHSDRAWLSLGGSLAPLRLTGITPNTYQWTNWVEVCQTSVVAGVTNIVCSNSVASVETRTGDIVTLQYTNAMTTYEGTEIWDHTLFPEQLQAHYGVETNMFLVKWDNWYWTNSVAYTSAAVIASFSDEIWPEERWAVTSALPIIAYTEVCDEDAWASYNGWADSTQSLYTIICPLDEETFITNNVNTWWNHYFFLPQEGAGVSTNQQTIGTVYLISWRNSRDNNPPFYYTTEDYTESGVCPSYTNYDMFPNTGIPEPRPPEYGIDTSTFCSPWTNNVYTYNIIIPETVTHSWVKVPHATAPSEYYVAYTTNAAGSVTNHPDCLEPGDVPVAFIKEEGCPWIPDFSFPGTASPGDMVAVENQAPYFSYELYGDLVVTQSYSAFTVYPELIGTNENPFPVSNVWTWDAYVSVVGGAAMNGFGVDSSVGVSGLWTGTPHRVHFYSQPNFTGDQFPRTNYFRSHLTDWTTASTVVSPPYSCWSNFNGGTFAAGACWGETPGVCYPIHPTINKERCENSQMTNVITCEAEVCTTNIEWIAGPLTNVPILKVTQTSEVIGYTKGTNTIGIGSGVLECSISDPKEYNSTTNYLQEWIPVWTNIFTTNVLGSVSMYKYWTWWIVGPNDEYFATGCAGEWDGAMSAGEFDYTEESTEESGWSLESVVTNETGYSIGCGENWWHVTTSNSYQAASSNAYYATYYEGPTIWKNEFSGDWSEASGEYDMTLPGGDVEQDAWIAGHQYTFSAGQYPVETNVTYNNTVNDVKVLVEWQR